jgi:A/G-specific adenine glycosylase
MTKERQKLSATKDIVAAFLGWYRTNARDLPWRRTSDPYAIWISEVMLQQTQVKTVIPYWERWMRALPNVQALASAKTDQVLKLWEGLGYYVRARNLQRAARIIMKERGGHFPRTFDEIIALPGIGRYTAGAICSIAFDQPKPVLDGNVTRVLARLYAVHGNPKSERTNQRLWKLAEECIRAAHESRINGERPCAELNQALMELGATLCTASSPDCKACPVQKHCAAFARGCVHRLPLKAMKTPSTERRFVAVVLRSRNRFLVRKRPAGMVNCDLWEFPNAEIRGRGRVRDALRDLGGAAIASKAFRIKHTITRYRITLDVFQADANENHLHGKWCSREQLGRLAFSSAHRRIADRLTAMVARREQL